MSFLSEFDHRGRALLMLIKEWISPLEGRIADDPY